MNAIKIIATAAVAAGMVAGMTACTAENDTYARVCENQGTHQRVTDEQCKTATHPSLIWVYIAATHRAPAVGEKITHATTTRPEDITVEDAPIHGGTIEEPHVNAPVEHAPVEEPIHISVRG